VRLDVGGGRGPVHLRQAPLLAVGLDRDPPAAWVDVAAAEQVDLDCGQRPLGIEAAVKVLLALTARLVAPPCLPALALPVGSRADAAAAARPVPAVVHPGVTHAALLLGRVPALQHLATALQDLKLFFVGPKVEGDEEPPFAFRHLGEVERWSVPVTGYSPRTQLRATQASSATAGVITRRIGGRRRSGWSSGARGGCPARRRWPGFKN
jgi:hypothetical protein